MKTKTLLVLLLVVIATAPASAAPAPNQKPQVLIIVDYDNVVPGRPHLFYGWCEYFRYFAPRFWPCCP